MHEREFDITIAADGNVEVHIKGYKGKRCLEAVRFLRKIIGQVQEQRETSEFYEPDEQVRYHLELGEDT